MPDLTIYLPGLFGPAVSFAGDYFPEAPSLEALLRHAGRRRLALQPFCARLGELFGLAPPAERDLPVAALTRLVDATEPPEGCWVRADPVTLQADRQRVVLLDSQVVPVSRHDALALAAEVQELFSGQGWVLEVPISDRWYVRLPSMPEVRTTELDEAAGRDLGEHMPSGADAKSWSRLLSEIQIRLHASEVNRVREQRGDPPVNSLWFWGAGELPSPIARRWSRAFGSDPLLAGLALISATPRAEAPESAQALLEQVRDPARILVVLEHCRSAARYQDLEAWNAALDRLEAQWFAPLLASLRRREISRLQLITDAGCFVTGRFAPLRFWRQRRSMGHYADRQG